MAKVQEALLLEVASQETVLQEAMLAEAVLQEAMLAEAVLQEATYTVHVIFCHSLYFFTISHYRKSL